MKKVGIVLYALLGRRKMRKTIVLKTTMNCNQRCSYCYEFNKGETNDRIKKTIEISRIKELLVKCSKLFPDIDILWMFHGGEPLLNSPKYFSDFCDCLNSINESGIVKYQTAIQTNGTLITDEWIGLFEKYSNILSERIISVSIDGPEKIHNSARKTINKLNTFDMVMNGINKIKKSNLNFTTISVVGKHNIDYPDEMYDFILSLNPNFSKFIPCYNFDSKGDFDEYGISPIEYASFMKRIFYRWSKDIHTFGKNGMFVIDPLITIISKIINQPVTWCEYRTEKCDNFLSIFPDGDLWLCDTYTSDLKKYAHLCNIFSMDDEALKEVFYKPNSICDYDSLYLGLSEYCKKCEIQQYCNGGCLPYRKQMLNASKKLFNEYCLGKRELINYVKNSIDKLI